MQDHGLTRAGAQALMAEAQKHAQRIIETGDASELAGLDAAAAELDRYQPDIDRLAPVLEKVAMRLGVQSVMPGDTGGAVVAQ